MSSDPKGRVAILWHMHQPEYRIDGVPRLPWSYLHALRAYTDMASHLEAVPGMRAVINFSPVLIDQVLDLAAQAQAAALRRTPPAEPLLAALLAPPQDLPARRRVLAAAVRAHDRNAGDRFTDYARLQARGRAALAGGDDAIAALPDGFLTDLLVWYHLVWLGESVRNADARSAALLAQRSGFEPAHRRGLLELVAELLARLLPRYRALAASGRVELAMNPYCHPLLPLLLDFASAREAAPGMALPSRAYPGGLERARWHLRAGRARMQEVFGMAPRGCWPSEAGVSQATSELIAAEGFDWIATSQSVQDATLRRHGEALDPHACIYRLDGTRLRCFFRDDGLSDRIGFVYKDWQPHDAVADLLRHLEALSAQRDGRAVVLALDGENPWEYYPENGIGFVRGFYHGLATHPRLHPATFAECLADEAGLPVLPTLVAGSWVHGELLTWVGHPEKNRAWELLIDAKQRYDAKGAPPAAAQHALAVCEGSDWFWWPGADNPGGPVSDFDALFRAHLAELYRQLGEPAPPVLDQPFASTAPVVKGAALGAMLPHAS
jgi:alpha-amylase/alpha-mannosidase (GH57 family)